MSGPNETSWRSRPRTLVILGLIIPALLILAKTGPSLAAAPCLFLAAGLLIVWVAVAAGVWEAHRKLSDDGPLPAAPRWFHLTPGKFLVGLLAVDGYLLLARQPGRMAVATLAVGMLFMLFWFITARIYGWRFQFSLRSLFALVVAVAIPFSWRAVEIKRATDHFMEDFKNLRALSLYGPKITDAALGELEWPTRLTHLDLDATAVTDAGLLHLKNLENLKVLSLHASPITGKGLAQLSRLRNLTVLDLSGTNVTDAELEHLNGLTNLRSLSLVGTKVTAAGVKRLHKALPNCKIDWPPPAQPVPAGTSGRPDTP
ncbi:MAG: leucine-rich repeat domain-containing protein [Pirellulales bacterium]